MAAKGLRRVGASMADQFLYSASNFGLTVLVARATTVEGFGAYSLLLASSLIATAVVRGLTSETLVVRHSAAETRQWRRAAENAGGAVVLLGLLVGAGFVVAGLFLNGSLGRSAMVFGAVVPGLFLQDYLRYAAISHKRPTVALANDAVQVVVQFVVAGLIIAGGIASPPTLVAAWGGSAYLGAIVGVVMLRLRPRVGQARTWFREERELAVRYALDDFGAQAGPNAATYVVAALTGLTGPAALRGAQTVFGPPSILNLGVQVAVVPELVRTLQRSVKAMTRLAVLVGFGLAAVAAVWALAVLVAPDSVGRGLFGPTWDAARPLLLFYAINQVAAGFRQTPVLGLRALGAAKRSLNSRVIVLTVGVVFQVVGAFADGAYGVAVATAVSGPVMALGCWWQFQLAIHDRRPPARHAAVRKAGADVGALPSDL